MKEVIILRGAPGSGKSSLARLLLRLGGPEMVEVISADAFLMAHGRYVWTRERCAAAHIKCWEQFDRALRNEMPVIVIDNTNAQERDFGQYVLTARSAGYNVRCVVVENRHGGRNEHDVPEETIVRMKDSINRSIQL